MGRKKIKDEEKCVIYSVSIIPSHDIFLTNNKKFKLSSFVQIYLQRYIDNYLDIREYERRI